MASKPAPECDTQLLTIKETATLLSVSVRSVWTLIGKELLTPIRLSRRITRIRASDVEALIEAAEEGELPHAQGDVRARPGHPTVTSGTGRPAKATSPRDARVEGRRS